MEVRRPPGCGLPFVRLVILGYLSTSGGGLIFVMGTLGGVVRPRFRVTWGGSAGDSPALPSLANFSFRSVNLTALDSQRQFATPSGPPARRTVTGEPTAMTATLHETVLPPAEDRGEAELVKLHRALISHTGETAGAKLVDPDGGEVELPDSLYRVLRDVLESLLDGQAVSVVPRSTMLTTQEAADFLGISRPTLVRLLEEGEIPHTKPGRHRRIKLVDVLKYERRVRATRRQSLARMAERGQATGMYDGVTDGPPPKMR